MPQVAVLFEFPTLNGGEHSMLAALESLSHHSQLNLAAIAPPDGPLAEQLAVLNIPLHPLQVRGSDGTKTDTSALHSALRQIVGQLSPDILHGNSLSMSRLIGQLDFAGTVSCHRTGHLRDIIRLNRTVVADLNGNDQLIAVSHATREYHIEQGLGPDRCTVIHNGVDIDRFCPHRNAVRRSDLLPQIPENATLVLSVGQICLRKGQLLTAKAICELLPERPDIYLVIAGQRHSEKSESIAYENAIRETFDRAGMPDHLHMLGYRTDIVELMNAADLLVHAAHQEPFGRTLLEAAACELPIVATTVGGTREMLRADQDAILIPANDIATLRRAVEQLSDDQSLRRRLAETARSRVVQHFAVDKAARQLEQVWLNQIDSASVSGSA